MVERTLPKPDTRVRFPSAAPQAPDFVAGLFPRLKRESLPGGNTFPRALGISAFQPVSRSTSPGPYGLGLYFFELGWTGRGGMFLAPTGNPSSLRVGRPDVATEHTGLSPCFPPLLVVRGRVRGCAAGMRTTGYSAWEECAGTGRGNTRVRYRRQLAKNEYWVQGIAVVPQGRQCAFRELIETGLVVAPCERTAQLYLPEATSGCPSSARAGPL